MMQNSFSTYIYKSLKNLLLVLLLVVVLIPFTGGSIKVEAQSSQLSCVDAVPQGGISASLHEVDDVTVAQGQVLTLPLSLASDLPYSLSGLNVYAAVYKTGSVVPLDWFTLAEGIVIDSNETQEMELKWPVSGSFESGAYTLSVFANQSTENQFLSSSFGNFSPKVTTNVLVTGESQPSVAFDLDTLTVNGERVSAHSLATISDDATSATVSIALSNSYTEKPVVGDLQITIYEGFYPNPSSEVETFKAESRLVSGVTDVSEVTFDSVANEYLVVGKFTATDGEQSSFILPLKRNGSVASENLVSPEILSIAVDSTGDSESNIVGCIGVRNYDFTETPALPDEMEISYRIALYELNESGTRKEGPSIFSVEKTATIGGVFGSNIGFIEAVTNEFKEYGLAIELIKDGVVVDSKLVAYSCENPFMCDGSVVQKMVEKTFLGIGVNAFVYAFQIVTFTILLIIISLFTAGAYHMIRRRDGNKKSN